MAIPDKYICTNGQTWDSVAYECYGDGQEMLFTIILEANPEYKDYLAFEGGEELVIPHTNDTPFIAVGMPFGQEATISIIDTPWG